MTNQGDLVVGTAGHIDHGKTALVRALTGVDTDRLPDERRRGITIDLGFAALDLGSTRVALVDVPGHERFLRNMLAGATGLDLAILVIAADDSVMPQTREHLEVLELLGLRGGVVALTKSDLADPGWLGLVEDEARALIAGTFLEGAAIVRTSVATGEGLESLREALRDLCARTPSRSDPGLYRMAIDRSFSVAGQGTVASGSVASGSVAPGDEVEWWPSGRPLRVRGVHRHGLAEQRVSAGGRAAVNLAGVRHDEVGRGDELASPGYLAATRAVSVEVRRVSSSPRPLRHRGRYRLHIGTAEVSATLSLFEGGAESADGAMTLGQLFLAGPIVAVHGQPFVLREESPAATVGGGRVLVPLARRVRRRDQTALAILRRLRSADPAARLAAALTLAGTGTWTERALARDSGVPVGEVPGLVEDLTSAGAMVAIPTGPRRTTRLLAEVAADLDSRILRAIARLHEVSPRQSTVVRSRVAAALAYLEDEALVSGLIDRLAATGKVVAEGRTVALVGFVPKLSQSERKLKAEIAEAFRAGGMTPPDLATWTTKANPKASAVPELLALLRDEERIVPIGPDFYLDFDVAADLRRRVADRLADGSSLSMAELRDLLGTTRKYAVPIGEYLDRIGLTRRAGDIRRLASLPAPTGSVS